MPEPRYGRYGADVLAQAHAAKPRVPTLEAENGLVVECATTGWCGAVVDWQKGAVVSPADLGKLGDWMADALVQAIASRPLPPDIERLFLTEPLPALGDIGGVMVSGGVAEFFYGRETRDFGDLGRLLGSALRRKLESGALPWPVLPAGECIRATALGASEYSVQLSGNTSYISNPGTLLPRRNLQVLQPAFEFAEEVDGEALGKAIIGRKKGEKITVSTPRGPVEYQVVNLDRITELYVKAQNHLAAEDGATAVEYGLIVALIAAVIVGIVAILGGKIASAFSTVSSKL